MQGTDRFTTDDLRAITSYLQDPLDGTDLVLSTVGAPPKHLLDTLKQAGGIAHDTDPPAPATARLVRRAASAEWRGARRGGGRLGRRAAGEDVGRLNGLLGTLDAASGPGRKLAADDVAPFLGEAGSVPAHGT